MYTPAEVTGQQSLHMAAFVALFGIIIIITERRWYHLKELRNLERLFGCKRLPDESDRYGGDFLGIAKALELASHFKGRSSLQYTNSLFQRYGETYSSNVLTYRMIFTCNAENIKSLLSTSFANFDGATLRKPMFKPLTPHGIFTVDGAEWKSHRASMRSRLSNPREIVDLNSCEGHFQDFCQHVPPNGQVFDVQACVSALVLDIQTRFALGESIDALNREQSPEKKQFQDDLLFVTERIIDDGYRGPLRYLYSRRTFHQSCKRARDYVSAYIPVHIEGQSNGDKKTAFQTSLLIDQTLDVMLANDSMSTSLSGLFYCLAQDERVVSKLRASILETVGVSPPSWEQLGELHYVRWVLQEAMRLFPPVVFNARVANKHCTLPKGGGPDRQSPVLVKRGDIVVYSTWASHRFGKQFGENPENFYPERWESLRGEIPGYIPFNTGPRVCPGRHIAMLVLTYIVSRIFQTYSTVSNYNTEEWKERIRAALENENGVLIGLS